MNNPTNQFQWTDELVIEYSQQWARDRKIPSLAVDLFKQSKTKKEEPKEWQICAVRDVDGKLFYTDIPPTKGEKIEAVKRLSDGEVFTVGDTVGWGVMKDYETKLLEFRIDEKGVLEFKYMNFVNRYSYVDFIKAHELYKKKEPLPIKVGVFLFDDAHTDNRNRYKFTISHPIPESKYEPIKKAIESVLRGDVDFGNIETFNRGYSMGRYDTSKYGQIKYTEAELLEAQKKAFEAAREINYVKESFFNDHYTALLNSFINCSKYKSKEDFIKSLNK